jgi:two-component system, OmpR family, alkaline phosphatase synthesis response regulator PhoP
MVMPRKVLIADDEPLTAEMMALMLSFQGYDVVCALDGADALRQARAEKPDLVLLDVCMPKLEGDEVTRALRSDPDLAGCPVILFSSADESDVLWREAGANLFMQKPLDIRKLPAFVESVLEGSAPR